jgi:hypothetical protein
MQLSMMTTKATYIPMGFRFELESRLQSLYLKQLHT